MNLVQALHQEGQVVGGDDPLATLDTKARCHVYIMGHKVQQIVLAPLLQHDIADRCFREQNSNTVWYVRAEQLGVLVDKVDGARYLRYRDAGFGCYGRNVGDLTHDELCEALEERRDILAIAVGFLGVTGENSAQLTHRAQPARCLCRRPLTHRWCIYVQRGNFDATDTAAPRHRFLVRAVAPDAMML